MKLRDILEYSDAVEAFVKGLKTLRGFRRTPVGETVEIPRVVSKIRDQEWEIPAHPARRLR